MIPSLQGKSPIYLPVNQFQLPCPIPFLVSPNVAPLPLSHWPHTLGRRPFWHQRLLGLSQGHSSGSLSCLLLLALRRPGNVAFRSQEVSTRLSPKGLSMTLLWLNPLA